MADANNDNKESSPVDSGSPAAPAKKGRGRPKGATAKVRDFMQIF